MHEFETTRNKSLGGTGIAGLLMEESAFLNPAGLTFFKQSIVYAQRDSLQIKNEQGTVIQKPKSTSVVIADGNENLSGSISYTHQEEGSIKRSRWGASSSAQLGASGGFGISLRKTEDENTVTKKKIDYYQTVLGFTQFINQQSSFGFVAYDVFGSKGDATKALAGFQQIFAEAITLSADIGGNYKADKISDTLLYRAGLQLRVLNDFYLRFGVFKDKEESEKGNSYGLSWVQPKLAFTFALKNTTQEKSTVLARSAEAKIRDLSLGLSFRF